MTHRGNITFKSVECEYDEIFEAYNVGDDIKTSDKILRDYYISSGYFVFLDSFFWRELFKYLFLEDIVGEEPNEEYFDLVSFFSDDFDLPFSFNKAKIKDRFLDVLEIIDEEYDYSNQSLFNLLNLFHLNMFDDFLKVFLSNFKNDFLLRPQNHFINIASPKLKNLYFCSTASLYAFII